MPEKIERPCVEVWIPTYRDTCWSELLLWVARESMQSRHLTGILKVAHRPIAQARQEICEDAFMAPGGADAVLMIDDDLCADVAGRPELSVVDHVVKVWSRAEAARLLYAPAVWQSGATGAMVLNEERDPEGNPLRGGTAFMLVPRAVWTATRRADIRWESRQEDYRYCDAVRELGMRVEAIPELRVRHRTEWRAPLELTTDAEGRPVRAAEGDRVLALPGDLGGALIPERAAEVGEPDLRVRR